MKTLIALLIACWISIIPLKAEHIDGSPIGVTGGSSIFLNSNGIGTTAELNLTIVLFNATGSIHYQPSMIPKYNFYFGLGLGNFLQFQFGTGFPDRKLRIQSIIPIFTDDPLFFEDHDIRYNSLLNRINLHLFYEKNYSDSKMSNFGLGFQFLII